MLNMECSHFSSAVQLTSEQIKRLQPLQWLCAVCRTQKSPWICLTCGIILCGRYVNGHAKQHAKLHPDHCLCMDQGLAIFCYRDDEFIVNENQIVRELRSEIERKMDPQRSLDYDVDESPPLTKKAKTETRSCPTRTCGLQNLGNTCFMNAILQPLNNLELFFTYFKQLPVLDLKEDKDGPVQRRYNTRRSVDLAKVSLVEEMAKVSCGLWQRDVSFFCPQSLFSVLWKLVPQFRGYQQQDAHEFMRYLLDKLHSELLQTLTPPAPSKPPPSTSVATLSTTSTASTPSHAQAHHTVVSDIFGGVLQSDVTCLACECESRKLDPILDVSLDIPTIKEQSGQPCTLTGCLSRFTSKETLEESEWYYCLTCGSKQPSTKQLTINSLPKVLCIHLKRFRFTSFLRSKVNTPVSFPLHSLDLSPFTIVSHGNTLLYDLAAVVVHHGSGVSCGHYTAYVYSPNAGLWYHFNDSSVSETTPSRVMESRPYILFYVQRTVNSNYYHQASHK